MTNYKGIPVIAIDGPTASGKGTVSSVLAKKLGFHYLDSGAIYRGLGVAVSQQSLNPQAPADFKKIEALSKSLHLEFEGSKVFLENQNVTTEIRTEQAGVMASKLASYPVLRQNLLARQRAFQKPPGLVADGRDMGSVVFPQAIIKVFLTASVQVRANRRFQQLEKAGETPDYEQLFNDLKSRDERDTARRVAPLKPTTDAVVIDSSQSTVEQVVNQIFALCCSQHLVEK